MSAVDIVLLKAVRIGLLVTTYYVWLPISPFSLSESFSMLTVIMFLDGA